MATQALMISNLPAGRDGTWLRQQAKHPARIASVTTLCPDDVDKLGITLRVELAGDKVYADNPVSRFHATTVQGREVRLYAPVFGG